MFFAMFILLTLLAGIVAFIPLTVILHRRYRRIDRSPARRTLLSGFVASVLVIVLIWYTSSDADIRVSYYVENIRPNILRCKNDSDGEACLQVAKTYLTTTTGRCNVYRQNGVYIGSRQCVVARQNDAKALRYAILSCEAGVMEGCTRQAMAQNPDPDTLIATLTDQCQRGGALACTTLKTIKPTPQSTRGSLPCHANDGTACASLMRNTLLDMLNDDTLDPSAMLRLYGEMRIFVRAPSAQDLTPEQAEAITTLLEISEDALSFEAMVSTMPAEAAAAEKAALKARIEAVKIPEFREDL